jgi:valyl-tRNA synthetase
MGTLSDILKFWVSRMIMFSLYLKKTVPFKDVYLWSMVADAKGQKMSKSKGNVVNPIDLVDKYGADSLRMALIYGTATGSKIILSDDKVRAMRNFANKIWNASRFILMTAAAQEKGVNDQEFVTHLKTVVKDATTLLNKYQLGLAAEKLYEEFWHWFCDQKIEEAKQGKISQSVLLDGLRTFLKLLHPFVPFVTEAVWQQLPQTKEKLLITAAWPKP